MLLFHYKLTFITSLALVILGPNNSKPNLPHILTQAMLQMMSNSAAVAGIRLIFASNLQAAHVAPVFCNFGDLRVTSHVTYFRGEIRLKNVGRGPAANFYCFFLFRSPRLPASVAEDKSLREMY